MAEEIGMIDQNLANNLARVENFEPGSKERDAMLAESKFYESSRNEEAKIDIEYRKLDLAEKQLAFDKQKHEKDTMIKIAEIGAKVVLGLAWLTGGLIVSFGEMDLEENGGNRSKSAQKFGTFFKPWKQGF